MNEIIEQNEYLLEDLRKDQKQITIPMNQLSTLGAAFSTLVPSFRTSTFHVDGLYQVANAGKGDVLKLAKNGNAWGALKTSNGASKMAQFKEGDLFRRWML